MKISFSLLYISLVLECWGSLWREGGRTEMVVQQKHPKSFTSRAWRLFIFVHRSWIIPLIQDLYLRSGTLTSLWVRMTSRPSATSTSPQCSTTSGSALQNPNSFTLTVVRRGFPRAGLCCPEHPEDTFHNMFILELLTSVKMCSHI